MLTWILLLLIGVAAVSGVAWVIARRPLATSSGGLRRHAERAVLGRDSLVSAVGAPVAALSVLLAGLSATFIVCWPLGYLAGRVERQVDVPVFNYVQARDDHGAWNSINLVLTHMGNRPQIKLVCVVMAVVLGYLWRRRAWWLPALAIAVAFTTEKYAQKALALVVHRGHPPTTLGTYPSGGCARLVSIYGVMILLLVLLHSTDRRLRLVLWTALSLAAFVEGYTRTYLSLHWFTDVVAGWIFGSLLLGVLVATTTTLLAGQGSRSEPGRSGKTRVSV